MPLELQPPGIVISGGEQGTLRPSGRDTVYGRAFDAAGIKTYLQSVDVTLRQDMATFMRPTKTIRQSCANKWMHF
ncbi:MAG: hypothetical protein U5K75_00135 [Ahrensia sp.]|nr:hypothetical protein [Ahrensia sp.]